MNPAVQGLKETVQSGNEEAVKQYIRDHWGEFPKKIRDTVFTGLFIDALRENTRQNEAFEEFKKELINLLEEVANGVNS